MDLIASELRVPRVEVEGVVEDVERHPGLALGVGALDATAPDLPPQGLGNGHEVEGAAGRPVGVRRRVGFAPAVVVLADGGKEGGAPRMRRDSVGAPQREEVARQPRVVRLGDELETAGRRCHDHPTENSRADPWI